MTNSASEIKRYIQQANANASMCAVIKFKGRPVYMRIEDLEETEDTKVETFPDTRIMEAFASQLEMGITRYLNDSFYYGTKERRV
jgi:hypothetical protein